MFDANKKGQNRKRRERESQSKCFCIAPFFSILGAIRETTCSMGKTEWQREQSSVAPKSKPHLKSRDVTGLRERACPQEGAEGIAWVTESFGKHLFSS